MQILSTVLPWIQIVLAALLIVAVLMQRGEAGLGGGFGGGMSENIERTRRGFEKTLFDGTIIISILFALSALIALFIR